MKNRRNTSYNEKNPVIALRLESYLKQALDIKLEQVDLDRSDFLRAVIKLYVENKFDIAFDREDRPHILPP